MATKKKTKKTETILEEAARIIGGDRREAYGPVRQSFETIAQLWTKVIFMEVTSTDVAKCMIMMKMSREINKHDRDNLVDICGYAALLEELEEGKSGG